MAAADAVARCREHGRGRARGTAPPWMRPADGRRVCRRGRGHGREGGGGLIALRGHVRADGLGGCRHARGRRGGEGGVRSRDPVPWPSRTRPRGSPWGMWSPPTPRWGGGGLGTATGVIASADKSVRRPWEMSPRTRGGGEERSPPARTRPRRSWRSSPPRTSPRGRPWVTDATVRGRVSRVSRVPPLWSWPRDGREGTSPPRIRPRGRPWGVKSRTRPRGGGEAGSRRHIRGHGTAVGMVGSAETSARKAVGDALADEAAGREGAGAASAAANEATERRQEEAGPAAVNRGEGNWRCRSGRGRGGG